MVVDKLLYLIMFALFTCRITFGAGGATVVENKMMYACGAA